MFFRLNYVRIYSTRCRSRTGSGALSLPAEPIERDIQRKVLEPQLTCRHWHIPVLCYRVCSRFEDFQPLKTFQKNISTPKLQCILRYFCSLVVACFGVAVSSQYPALGKVRFYFLYAKWLFKTHLTPSYRLFSILDATPIYRIGAPPLVAVKSATVNGRSVSPFSVRPSGIRLAGECQRQGE